MAADSSSSTNRSMDRRAILFLARNTAKRYQYQMQTSIKLLMRRGTAQPKPQLLAHAGSTADMASPFLFSHTLFAATLHRPPSMQMQVLAQLQTFRP